jgi:uncharacterized protein (UPF0276 family)
MQGGRTQDFGHASDRRPASSQPAARDIPIAAGIGMRAQHFETIVNELPAVGWLEIHPENYLGGGAPLAYLKAARNHYPVAMHGVGLSLGSALGVDGNHLARLVDLAARIEPGLVSEHVSWSVHDGVYLNDLLPLPYTDESLDIICRNVDRVQTAFRQNILVENASTYLEFRHSTIPEAEFIRAIAEQTGCGVLLDINNVYVSCQNHGWDVAKYLEIMADVAVGEIHLAGHAVNKVGGRVLRIDDHGSKVAPAVWDLYRRALDLLGPVPTLIEWDTDIPALEVLLAEAAMAQDILEEAARHADAA